MAKQQLGLIPALRIKDGQIGSVQPDVAVRDWLAQGVGWVHLLDESAVAGGDVQVGAINSAHFAAHPRGRIEVSTGAHDPATFDAVARSRADRIVLDLAADTDPDWLKKVFGDQGERVAVAIGVDPHHGTAAGGPFGTDLVGVVVELTRLGCPRFIVTNTDQPGFWHHVHPASAIEPVVAATHRPVVARGRMDRLEDLHRLAELAPQGLEAVIVDHIGSELDFADAITALQARYDPWMWGPAPA